MYMWKIITPEGITWSWRHWGVQAKDRLVMVEKVNASEIINRLVDDRKIPYRNKEKLLETFNTITQEIVDEVSSWKRVMIRNFWNFYPFNVKARSFRNSFTWEMQGFTTDRCVIRFLMSKNIKKRVNEMYTWIKFKTNKK